MATCSSWQAPYGDSNFPGNSVSEVCAKLTQAYWSSEATFTVNGEQCIVVDGEAGNTYNFPKQCDAADPSETTGNVIQCGQACSVAMKLEPAPPSEEHLADIGALFSLFMVAAVVVFCAKQLLNLFRVNHHED